MPLPAFIEALRDRDPDLYEVVSKLALKSMGPGALEPKTKILITLALDAIVGAEQGVKGLAAQARRNGASEEEIAETLRLAYFVAGNSVLVASAFAYQDPGK